MGRKLSRYGRGPDISRFLVLHKPLDAGELTRTHKVRRGCIAGK